METSLRLPIRSVEAALFESFEGRGFPTFLVLAKNQPAREIPTSCGPKFSSKYAKRQRRTEIDKAQPNAG